MHNSGAPGYPPQLFPYHFFPLPPQLYGAAGATPAGIPPGSSSIVTGGQENVGLPQNFGRGGSEAICSNNESVPPKLTVGAEGVKEATPRSPTGGEEIVVEGDDKRRGCGRHALLEAEPTSIPIGQTLDARFITALQEQCDTPEDQAFQFFSRLQWRHHRTYWHFHRPIPVLLQSGRSLSSGMPIVCSIFIGDSQSHLFPHLKGSNLLDTTSGPQMKLALFGETLPDLCLGISCTEPVFNSIKHEQNLHVPFGSFENKVIDLLSTVAESNLVASSEGITEREATGAERGNEPGAISRFLATLELSEESGILSVVEATPFRSLTHISLKLNRWKCCDVRQALSGQLTMRKKYQAYLEAHLRHALDEWDAATVLSHQREAEISEMKSKQAAETRAIITQHRDDLKRLAAEEEERGNAIADQYEKNLARISEDKARLKQQLNEALAGKRECESRIGILETEVARAAGWEAEKQTIQDDLKQLELLKQTAARESQQSEIIADLRARNLALEGKLNELADAAEQLSRLRDENAEKSKQVAAYKSRLRDTADRLEEKAKNYEALQAQFTELREDTEELRKVFETRNEVAKEREKEAGRLADKVQGLEMECQKLLQANFELNKRLTESLVRMAKWNQPEHFDLPSATLPSGAFHDDSDAPLEDILFPEATPNQGSLHRRHSTGPFVQSATLPQASGPLDDAGSPVNLRQAPLSYRLSLLAPQATSNPNSRAGLRNNFPRR